MIPHLTNQSQETPDISQASRPIDQAEALAILSRTLVQIETMERQVAYQVKRNMVEMETLRLQLKASGM